MALGEPQHIFFARQPGSFVLSRADLNTELYVDSRDWPGVGRAASSLAHDLHAVTGRTPQVLHTASKLGGQILIIGTIGHSCLVDQLIAENKLDVSKIEGHWETSVTQVVAHPLPGIASAVVIAGADKRGTIFGIYDISEQIGVSPWAWWADVPVSHHEALYLAAGPHLQPEPKVKYRGIFLNDEEPALGGWARENFGGFNHRFYEHVFELLLRLKANFLWPAMWGAAFNEDDPLNPKLADEYGIVMGTSHHEPMMRAQQEWKRHGTGPWDYNTNRAALDAFWREGVKRNKDYEQLTTIGMRGDGDMAMSPATNTSLLETIVADQRRILSEEVNPDVSKVPQVWALYKEVQAYYEAGMRVPDDVTLLWCDDNWGNLRRLPTAEERKRPGGAGIYYHFDYVGDPRSYKWLNTYPVTKVWEQMHLAADYGADRLWIVNVGDLKPMEFPIEFFLSMARTPERWGKDQLGEYTTLWATREFGPQHANEIAALITDYTKYNSRRKPEQLDPDTYSLTTDHEADRIDFAWRDLTKRAERVSQQLPERYRAAFFELVLYPVKASAIVTEMYIAAGRNRLFARLGRADANFYADQTRQLFAADAALTNEYNHKLLHGKWNHMMDQTHIGYTYWNEPPLNAMPAVQEVQVPHTADMLVMAEGEDAGSLPAFDAANRQTRSIAIANRGSLPFSFAASTSAPWVHLSKLSGTVKASMQLKVTIDWKNMPAGDQHASIRFHQVGAHTAPSTIAVEAILPLNTAEMDGFVENAGYVAIEAEHFTSSHIASGVRWEVLPNFGETLSGMESFPVTAPSSTTAPDQACLDYDFYLYAAGPRSVESVLAPTLTFVPGHGLRYSVAIDSQSPHIVDAWANNTPQEWAKAVSDGVHKISTPLGDLALGRHTLHFCRVDPGIVLERLVMYGHTPPTSYLGPPESARMTIAAGK